MAIFLRTIIRPSRPLSHTYVHTNTHTQTHTHKRTHTPSLVTCSTPSTPRYVDRLIRIPPHSSCRGAHRQTLSIRLPLRTTVQTRTSDRCYYCDYHCHCHCCRCGPPAVPSVGMLR